MSGMNKNKRINSKKLTLSAFFVALTVVLSTTFYIPVGAAKCFPIQHLINILGAIFLGPVYSVSVAFVSSCIRNILGTGSLLAFPGSMAGALLSAVLYQKFGKLAWAYTGEVIGTGIIGAIISYPVAVFLLGKPAAIFTFVIPFSMSSVAGTVLAGLIAASLYKTKMLFSLKSLIEGE